MRVTQPQEWHAERKPAAHSPATADAVVPAGLPSIDLNKQDAPHPVEVSAARTTQNDDPAGAGWDDHDDDSGW